MSAEPMIYIVEDDDAVRRSIEVVVANAGYLTRGFPSAEEFLAAIRPDAFGCLILDLRLRGMNGLELLAELRRRECEVPALMVSGHGEIPVVVESVKLGAFDFIEKPLQPDVLLARVEDMITQQHVAKHNRQVPAQEAERLSQLTPREIEILRHLVAGKSSKQIALEMNLSGKTVSNHRAHLLAKTGAQNTAELVRLAVTYGIL